MILERRGESWSLEIEARLRAAATGGGTALIRQAHVLMPERLVVVSSFGAESAVLLSMVAEVSPSIPVIFLQTGMHFSETIEYRHNLAHFLGLKCVVDITPQGEDLKTVDPGGRLWNSNPDLCCQIRKVTPLDFALQPYDVWASGRKRRQSESRLKLEWVERDGKHLKLNPLADWDTARVEAEMVYRSLPRHPLVEEGYPSIGCGPCTAPVARGADPRSGRWEWTKKLECGIHRPILTK